MAAQRGLVRFVRRQGELAQLRRAYEQVQAGHGRLAKAKVYVFRQRWLGNYYEHKRVEVLFTIEKDVVITVTVYIFYGTWESIDAGPL